MRDSDARNESSLIVANEDGSGERQLAVRKLPNFFESIVAWSPNGKTIATFADNSESGVYRTNPIEIPVQGGAEHQLTQKQWVKIVDSEWFFDGRGLIVNGKEKRAGAAQIGYISYPNGEVRRITNDLNYYQGVSLTADSRALSNSTTASLRRRLGRTHRGSGQREANHVGRSYGVVGVESGREDRMHEGHTERREHLGDGVGWTQREAVDV